MSALLPEDSIDETEIVFTAAQSSLQTPFIPDIRQSEELAIANQQQLPGHVEFLKNKLKEQQLRKKLQTNTGDKRSPESASKNSRARLWKKMMARTESLNADAEKFNTQSAVLLSALQKLQANIESSQQDDRILLNNFKGLSSDCESLKQQLESGLEHLKTQSALTAKNNESAANFIERIDCLLSDTDNNHSASKQQAEQTLAILEKAQQHQTLYAASAESFSQLRSEAEDFVTEAKSARQEANEQSQALNELVERNQTLSVGLESMTQSMLETRTELIDERDTQQQLNESVRNRIVHTEKLNQQQSTLIELTESRSNELREELENSVRQNKKYQVRLQQTEEKLKEAIRSQESYAADYAKSKELLKGNEALLKKATTALQSTEGQNEKFNHSIAKFQQSNEQSQHLILRSQGTLEKIVARNEYLEKENRTLIARLATDSAPSMPNTSLPRQGIPPIAANTAELHNSASEDQLSSETPSFNDLNLEAKSGFYRLMMVLAIILPLSFIAHSVITTFAERDSAAANIGQHSVSSPTVTSSELSTTFTAGTADRF